MPDLNKEALEAAAEAVRAGDYHGVPEDEMDDMVAHLAITAYLEATQPILTTLEELEELPPESVLRDVDGIVFEVVHNGELDGYEKPYKEYLAPGDSHAYTSSDVVLPAHVIYTPQF